MRTAILIHGRGAPKGRNQDLFIDSAIPQAQNT
jgi:hypothetical protein